MIIEVHKCRNIVHPFPVIAWLIMLFQGMLPWRKSSYSHMAISITMENSNQRFFECRLKEGCREQTAEQFLKNYRLVESHQLAEQRTYVEFMNWFRELEGRNYDKLQLWGLAAKTLKLLKFNKIGHNLEKLTCNELLIAYFSHFYELGYCDSDDFDLNMTWKIAKGY